VSAGAAQASFPFEIYFPVVPFGAGRQAPGKDFRFPAVAVSSVIDIGGRLNQVGTKLGLSISGVVQHAIR
jgi:hypothetical protein